MIHLLMIQPHPFGMMTIITQINQFKAYFMGNYQDDAKLSFIGMVGLIITVLLIILFSKC